MKIKVNAVVINSVDDRVRMGGEGARAIRIAQGDLPAGFFNLPAGGPVHSETAIEVTLADGDQVTIYPARYQSDTTIDFGVPILNAFIRMDPVQGAALPYPVYFRSEFHYGDTMLSPR